MSSIKHFEEWRAEQIAKVALLNGGFNHVYENPDNKFDLVAVSGGTESRQYFVEVKASKSPKQALNKGIKNIKQHLPKKQAVMMVVVDSQDGEGIFKVIESGKESEVLPLKKDELEKISGREGQF